MNPRDPQLQFSVRRSTLVAAFAGGVLALGLVAGLSWAAPAQLCAKGLYCMAEDGPALAGEVNGNFAAVAVGVGSIVAHTTNLAGSETVAEMQARGFALCNGTTPASQGITNALITVATPDLNGGRFLRGGAAGQSGALEDDATAVNGLATSDPGHDHVTMTTDNCNAFNGAFTVAGVTFRNVPLNGAKRTHNWDTNATCNSGHYTNGSSTTGVGLTSADAETRPSNMRVVWMMRVR